MSGDAAANIPFCLFFKLVRFCRRAPSSGANGWRVMVAMAERQMQSGSQFDLAAQPRGGPLRLLSSIDRGSSSSPSSTTTCHLDGGSRRDEDGFRPTDRSRSDLFVFAFRPTTGNRRTRSENRGDEGGRGGGWVCKWRRAQGRAEGWRRAREDGRWGPSHNWALLPDWLGWPSMRGQPGRGRD